MSLFTNHINSHVLIILTSDVVPHFVTEVLHGRVRTLTPVTITLVTMLKSTMSCVEVDVDAVPLEEVDVVVLEEGVASGSS